MMSRMPTFYRPPWGGPLRWQDDATGVLPTAVLAFLDHSIEETPAQIELVRDYCEYYIAAPCWVMGGEVEQKFTDLRERVKSLKSAKEIDVWIKDALNVGIDPL